MQKQETIIYTHTNKPVFFQAESGASVTPSDDTVFQVGTLYVGTTGSIKVTTVGGSALTFVGVPAGAFLPVLVTKVWATGTDADDILILR